MGGRRPGKLAIEEVTQAARTGKGEKVEAGAAVLSPPAGRGKLTHLSFQTSTADTAAKGGDMAGRRAGGGRSRMDLRREAEAAEAREREGEVVEEADDEEADDDEEEEEEGEEAEAEGEAEAGDEEAGDDDDDEDAPKKKKAKKKVVKAKVVKAPAKKRATRAAKEERFRAVWRVFDNSGKVAGTFPYPQRKEAEELLAAKTEEKKTSFYILLVKEKMEA